MFYYSTSFVTAMNSLLIVTVNEIYTAYVSGQSSFFGILYDL